MAARGEMVLVTNLGLEDWEDAYDGIHYGCPSGGSVLVPRDGANLWFGDPTLLDRANDKARTRAWDAIRARYGGYDDPEVLEANLPKVRVTSIDGTVEIGSIIDDPSGASVNPARVTEADQADLATLVERHERELAHLRSQLKADLRKELAMAQGGDIPEDEPPSGPAPKASRKRAAKKAATPQVKDAGVGTVPGAPVDAPEE